MIDSQAAKTYKKILGANYAKKIQDFLQKSGIRNSKGEDFSRDSIYQVMSGNQPNEAVELAIIELAEETLEKQKERKRREEALLK